MALISRLPSGGMGSVSRSTKIHSGSKQCANNVATNVFEFTGGGKVNVIQLKSNVNLGTDAYLSVVVDGVELVRFTTSSTTNSMSFFRKKSGSYSFEGSTSDPTLPLDIEFKETFELVVYATNNTPTMNYTIEIAEA